MNEIRIKRLCLENFKAHKHLDLLFDGRNAVIYGDNATGKTSIYDALTWLLFGKDSAGNGEKNMEVKPLDRDGNVQNHDALTSVEAVLLVNGQEISLRRTYSEKWSTKRGSSQATYDGNTSDYYVDGVPAKKTVFQQSVADMVGGEDTFRLLTSVSRFANEIPWQERRAVLYSMAGIMDDRAIMGTNAEFAPLLEAMGRLSPDELKRKLAAEKSGFSKNKDELPARISECELTIADIEGINFTDARMKLDALRAREEVLVQERSNLLNGERYRTVSHDVKEAMLERDTLQRENQLHRERQLVGMPDILQLDRTLTNARSTLTNRQVSLEAERKYIANMEKHIEDFRTAWHNISGEQFSGSGVCATCGQPLPADRMQKAREAFEESKQKRLDGVVQESKMAKESVELAKQRFISLQEDIKARETEISQLEVQIRNAKETRVEPTDLEGYAEKHEDLSKKIENLRVELMNLQTVAKESAGRIDDELCDIRTENDACQKILAKEELLQRSRERVQSLRDEAKKVQEALDRVEGLLYLLEEYSRYKASFVEDSVNSMFRLARFRMFREQANGGVEDRCDVTYNGVPYLNVNDGMKINLGIDIINTISNAYGVRVPLFVDNAESVTALEHCNSQRIRLVVSGFDKELRMVYET